MSILGTDTFSPPFRREEIFRDDPDRQRFLSALSEAGGQDRMANARMAARLRRETTMSLKWIAE
ncbi:MAG: hypothetical protein ABI651_04855 [Verrucomicrobiota bacterium]